MKLETSPFKVKTKNFIKKLIIPTSKSYANRMIILAALDKRNIKILNLPSSTDVDFLINCLKKVGLEIQRSSDEILISNSFPECEKKVDHVIEVESGDGGTTNRFLASFLSLGKNKYSLKPLGHMKKRPMNELEKNLKELGVYVETKDHWFLVQGPIYHKEKKIEIDCSQSTQFATAIQLILSKANIEVVPKNLKSSQMYWEMTKYIIKKSLEDCSWKVPIDFSSLSYSLALGVTLGEVEISNYEEIDFYQGDSQLIQTLKDMGAIIEEKKNVLKIKKSQLRGIEIDCRNCPDLVPTLAYICSYANGKSILKNIEVLRYKESDRIDEIVNLLKVFKVKYKLDSQLEIEGSENNFLNVEASLSPPDDHRIVMVGYLFLRKNSGGEISNWTHVKKSYGSFFQDME